MKVIANFELVALAKVWSEITQLNETADEWWFELFGLDKVEYYAKHASSMWPCWRDGFSSIVADGMHLRTQRFERAGGDPAVGVVLEIPDEHREKFIGWASADRADQIR